MTPVSFVEHIAAIRLPSVFNPYADSCPHFDLPDAPARRRRNLQAHLAAAIDLGVGAVWVGRDLGYRGGRRTGIALTDEPNLERLATHFDRRIDVQRATRGPIISERTAGVIWRAIRGLDTCIFTWNVFPLHPHKVDKPLTNRCHTRRERLALRPLLVSLLDMLQPKKVVAIGNDAQAGLADLGIECVKVRHPSYGGVSDFEAGISALHGGRTGGSHPANGATLF